VPVPAAAASIWFGSMGMMKMFLPRLRV